MPIEALEQRRHGIRIDPSDDAKDSAREFCSGALGLEADSGRPNIPGIPGFRMYAGDGEQPTRIHLMGAAGESPVARSAEEDPTRPHAALAVEDIQEARRERESRGIRHWTIEGLVGENPDQVFVPDLLGNVIELHRIGACRCNRVTLEAQAQAQARSIAPAPSSRLPAGRREAPFVPGARGPEAPSAGRGNISHP